MNHLLVPLQEIKRELGFSERIAELKDSPELLRYCLKNRVIASQVGPEDFTNRRSDRDAYTNLLVELTQNFLEIHPEIQTWQDFSSHKDTKKVHRLLFEFGVRGEVFPFETESEEKKESSKSKTSLTLPEFYELCQIQFHFGGTFESFKRHIQRQYGSFAEYCISKGYDINSTRWENDETAIRVAQKLGSLEEVLRRSKSLHKYLSDRDLLEAVFKKKAAKSA